MSAPHVGPRRGRLRYVVLVWALAWAASTAVRAWRDDEPPVPPGLASIELGGVRIAYLDRGEGELVLLLHGSPGSHRDFEGLVPLVADARRVIAPDLPGFGASTHRVDDYSFAAHARHVLGLLDGLGVGRAHVVGFSMGGAVGIELATIAPERVRSLTLLSSVGVVEHEWLGDHHLNRLLHGLQLAVLWSVRELVPHFGMLDRAVLGVPYARNFHDSDQRPLRAALGALPMPVAIVHGERDGLVPVAAALEHARIVPQARIDIVASSGHFLLFRRPERVASALSPFFADVEAGHAALRSDAPADRIARAAEPFDPRRAPLSGVPLLSILALLAAATLVSEDLACIGAGALVAQGRLGLSEAAAACFVGIYVGDTALFVAGRLLGSRALRMRPLRWMLDPRDVQRASDWFRRKGAVAILASRFMPGTRLPMYFAAGALRAPVVPFLAFFALAAALWTPAIVWLASRIGGTLIQRLDALEIALPIVLVAIVVTALVAVKFAIPLLSRRGRRRVVGRFRRIRHWEFWPMWAFYPPLVLGIAWLAFVRHRRPLAFTAANPAMPLGGLVGESKRAILSGLPQRRDERMEVARWEALPPGLTTEERVERVLAFRRRERLDWPIVLKPDAGQRGSGVLVAHGEDDVREYLEQSDEALLVQAFAAGDEFGLFYARVPGEDAGRILSVTVKRLPEVVGDGKRTLEDLILDDERAVAMARYLLRKNAARLLDVPARGERVAIGDLGTHARGAIFEDGAHLVTEELTRIVDEFSRGYEGFFFGRYDVRVPSAEHLRAGRGLVVIELNGVTSESTSIYDRRHGVGHAWRTLFAQWDLAYRIGLANAQRGAAVARARDVLRALREERRRPARRVGG